MFTIYYLEGCPYSQNAIYKMIELNNSKLSRTDIQKLENEDFSKINKKKGLKVPFKINFVTYNTMDKVKKQLKTQTFPQIYYSDLTRSTKKSHIGGSDDLEHFIDTMKRIKVLEQSLVKKGITRKSLDTISRQMI